MIFNLQEGHLHSLHELRLSLDSIYILERYITGRGIVLTNKTMSLIQELQRKGYLEGSTPTGQALKLYERLSMEGVLPEIKSHIEVAKQGIEGIHKKLEDSLVKLTGNKQVRPEIQGKHYSFLCNERDLKDRLDKVMTRYNLKDFNKIEVTLLRYVEECHKKRQWFPLLQYYIIKSEGGNTYSRLVTDLSNTGELTIKSKKITEI